MWAESSTSTIQPGGDLTFSVTLTNHGSTNVDHVMLTNQLPAGATYVDASPRPDVTGRWPIGQLTANGSTTTAPCALSTAIASAIAFFCSAFKPPFCARLPAGGGCSSK